MSHANKNGADAAMPIRLGLLSIGAVLAFTCGSVNAEPVQCPVAMWDDMSALFEQGTMLDLLNNIQVDGGSVRPLDKGIYVQSAETSGKGGAGSSLSVKEDFAGATAGRVVELRLREGDQPEIRRITDGVGLWVKTRPYVYLSFYFRDAAGRTLNIPAHRQRSADWEYAGAPLKSVILWDGPAAAEVKLPAHLTGIRLSTVKGGFNFDFSAELRGLQRVSRPEDVKPQRLGIDVDHPPVGLVYRPGQSVAAVFSAPSGDAEIRWRFVEYGGKVIAEGSAQGRADIQQVLPHVGHYRFLVELIEDGTRTDYRDLSLAVLEADQPVHDRIGLCGHWARPYYSLDSLDLLPLIGINRLRDHVPWHAVEVKPGVMRLPKKMSQFLTEARRRGIHGTTILNGRGTFYGGGVPRTPEAMEAFLDYCRLVAKEEAGVYDQIELWNEWSNGTGMETEDFSPTPENYVRLAEQVVPELRKVAPDAEIIGFGGENPYRFEHEIIGMLKAGGGRFFDSISLHPYRQPFPPEIVHAPGSEPLDETMKKFAALSRKYNGPKKIQITEMGYPTFRLNWGVSEVEHARLMIRTLAMLHSVPEVDEVYWYSLYDETEIPLPRNAPTSICYSQHAFGLFRDGVNLHAPKPTVVALAIYARQTSGGIFGPVHKEESGLHYVEVFEPDGTKRCTILWTINQPVNVKLTGKQKMVIDLMGRSHTAQKSVLRVSQDAVYLQAPAGIRTKR